MRLVTRTALAVFLLDQLTKFAVVHGLRLDSRGQIDVMAPWLRFRMAWNQGINFGLFAHSAEVMRWVLVAVALAISAWVWVWVRKGSHPRVVYWSAGLLIGGAIGNAVDRLVYGAVADFLNMSVPGIDNPWSFNVADVAIFAGALGLAFFGGREGPRPRDGRNHLR